MGRGSSKAGNRSGGVVSQGMTASESDNLHNMAMASLVARDDYAGTNLTTAQERDQYRLQFGSGTVEFERLQYDTLKTIAERNGIDNDFVFDEIRAQVRTSDGRFRVMGDDYAIARGLTDRSWIVNEFDTDSTAFTKPIIEQTRYSTPEAALEHVIRRRR